MSTSTQAQPRSVGLVEAIQDAAYFVWEPATEAIVVTDCGNCGFLASGRYVSKSSAFRAQRAIMARRNVNSYVVTKARGDSYTIWLDPHTTL